MNDPRCIEQEQSQQWRAGAILTVQSRSNLWNNLCSRVRAVPAGGSFLPCHLYSDAIRLWCRALSSFPPVERLCPAQHSGHLQSDVEEKTCKCNSDTEYFRRSICLIKHKSVNTKEKQFNYKECENYINEYSCITKTKKIHPREKATYKCNKSDKAFKESSVHKSYCNINPLMNPKKNGKHKLYFRSNSNHTTHIMSNTVRKSYTCEECGKCLQNFSNFRREQSIHTEQKHYICKACGKIFTHHSTLQKHCRIHNSDKPYKCEECGKSFTQSSTLQRHCRIHSGDKPYRCKECDKSFTQLSNLQVHNKIHTGHKPYRYKEYIKSFPYNSALQTHQRIHSK